MCSGAASVQYGRTVPNDGSSVFIGHGDNNMKKYLKAIASAAVCAVILLSGCSANDQGGSGSPAATSVSGSYTYPEGYVRAAAPEEAKIYKSTDAGNSGNVTIEKGDTYAVISIKDYGTMKIKLYPKEAPYAVQNFIDLANAGTYNGRNFHRIIDDFMAQGGSVNGSGQGGSPAEGKPFRNEINTSLRHYYGALCFASAVGNISDQFYIVNSKKTTDDLQSTYTENVDQLRQAAATYNNLAEQSRGQFSFMIYYQSNEQFYNEYADGTQAMNDTYTDAVGETYRTKGGVPFLDGGYTVFGQTVEGFEVLDKISAVEKVDDGNGNISKPATDIIIDKVEIFTAE